MNSVNLSESAVHDDHASVVNLMNQKVVYHVTNAMGVSSENIDKYEIYSSFSYYFF